jgi:hypothetical protein
MHLPIDTMLVNGVGSFNAIPIIAGSQTISATDTVTSSITGTSGAIAVGPSAATKLWVINPTTATVGFPYTFTVKAKDNFGNIATGYAGTVAIGTTDATVTLPTPGMLTNGDGTCTLTFNSNGTKYMGAADTLHPSISGTGNIIHVSPPLAYLRLIGPFNATVNVPFNLTVSARDAFGNLVTAYYGTVHLVSNHPASLNSGGGQTPLPTDVTLVNGVVMFSVMVSTAGNEVIVGTDALRPSIGRVSDLIVVGP